MRAAQVCLLLGQSPAPPATCGKGRTLSTSAHGCCFGQSHKRALGGVRGAPGVIGQPPLCVRLCALRPGLRPPRSSARAALGPAVTTAPSSRACWLSSPLAPSAVCSPRVACLPLTVSSWVWCVPRQPARCCCPCKLGTTVLGPKDAATDWAPWLRASSSRVFALFIVCDCFLSLHRTVSFLRAKIVWGKFPDLQCLWNVRPERELSR